MIYDVELKGVQKTVGMEGDGFSAVKNMSVTPAPKEERAFQAIERKLEAARRAQIRTDKLLADVFEAVSALGIVADEIPTEAENACNLEEAISCYVAWGEYSIPGILEEIRGAYDKK